MSQTSSDNLFHVPFGLRFFGEIVSNCRPFFIKLGNFESGVLEEELESTEINKPIYVAGLPRSGTTKVLDLLASLDGIATHQYRDFPPIFTPYAWNWYLSKVPKKKSAPVERTHKDGMYVTDESPEALEEVLWMSFFEDLHNSSKNNVLNVDTSNSKFEKFYRDHIKKILLVRKGSRYLAKGNYNLTRFGYIKSIFPEAKFVVLVRHPVWHIASLVKQHKLFTDGQTKNPEMMKHLSRVGHFEFGLNRKVLNVGDSELSGEIERCWSEGREVEGWAKYWAMIYGYFLNVLEGNRALKESVMVVRFEDLCDESSLTIGGILEHCSISVSNQKLSDLASTCRRPNYYKPEFSEEEFGVIEREVASLASKFGYKDLSSF